MSNAVRVADVGEIAPGTSKIVDVDGLAVALFNVEGEFFAIDNTCPHVGGALGDGPLEDDTVMCPWHGWKYNVKTGQACGAPKDDPVACFKVTVSGSDIMVDIGDH